MSSLPISSSSSEPGAADGPDLSTMFDVSCVVDVVLGSASVTVRDCLALEPNRVVKLTQPAGSELTVSVHGVQIAAGEIILTDDRAALIVTRAVPPPGVEPL